MSRKFTAYPSKGITAASELSVNSEIPVIVVLDRDYKETETCDSITQAQITVDNFIAKYGLGAGCSPLYRGFAGGEVFDAATKEYLGHISYNCRFWPVGDAWDTKTHGLIRDWSYFDSGSDTPLQITSSTCVNADVDTSFAELSDDEFKELVHQYRDSGATWTYIVAELKGTYGLENAKDIATAVEDERRNRKNKAAWDAYAN